LAAPLYFGAVAAVTVGLVVTAMHLRPTFGYDVRVALHLQDPPEAVAGSFYRERVDPIFQQHCISCHGPGMKKGQLAVHDFASVMRGGKGGPVVEGPALQKSELFRRMSLPSTDELAMPPDGKPPMSTSELQVVKLWIEHGASGETPVGMVKGAPRVVPPVTIHERPSTEVQRERLPLSALMASLQTKYPGVLSYEARDSSNIELNASLLGAVFGDEQLGEFAALASKIVRADLSNTAVTDRSAGFLRGLSSVEVLRLSNTKVSDAGVREIAANRSLKVMALENTSVTEASWRLLKDRGVTAYGWTSDDQG
jgi:hypothetical protein